MNKRQYTALISEHMNLQEEQQLALEYWLTVIYLNNDLSFKEWEALELCPPNP